MKTIAKDFLNDWEKEEGLIRPKEASELLNITKQAIYDRMSCGSLTTYEYIDRSGKITNFISLKEIKNISVKKNQTRKRK